MLERWNIGTMGIKKITFLNIQDFFNPIIPRLHYSSISIAEGVGV
jgi:hypothetical protein